MSLLNRPGEPGPASEIIYPTSDGKPMAETGIHVLVMVAMIDALRLHYDGRKDVYVIGNIFLYYREGDPKACRSPDVMVVKGVEDRGERDSFKTWEERAVPAFILEVTSRSTADEDTGDKFELYRSLGVRDYFLFDPYHEYLERQLMGYRLIGEEYELLPPGGDGGVVSVELGLRLIPEGTTLGLVRYKDGHRLPSPKELMGQVNREKAERILAERRAAEAIREREASDRHRAEAIREREASDRREAEAIRAKAEAEARADALEAELSRLRGLLPPQNP